MEKTNKKKQGFKSFLLPLINAVLFSIFLPVFMYTNNIEEADFKEVFPIILLFAGIGAAISGIVFLCCKKNAFISTVISVLLILFLSNYALVEKLVISIYPEIIFYKEMLFAITATAIIYLIAVIGFILYKIALKKNFIKEVTPAALAIAASALIVFNIVIALPTGIAKLQSFDKDADGELSGAASSEKSPNVYYLFFDEYSNSEMIKKYYDYDNSEFDRYLEDNGFAVSQDTKNGSVFTVVVAANYMNYDYVVNEDTNILEKERIRKENKLKELFLSKGYEIIGAGDSDFMGIPSVTQASRTESETVEGDSLRTIILKNTIYGSFKNVSLKGYDKKRADIINAVSHFSEENLKTGGNTFTMLYLSSPHAPYVFDKDGNPSDPKRADDFIDKKYYLDQYIYTTKLIQEIIDNILMYDKDSVIILQSDHASRNDCVTEEEDKKKPLNAVYFRGEDISEIKGQSGVNTIRIVLNRLFDMDLEILEMTEY